MGGLHFGRSVGIRTRGLLDPNQARYQTSPHPDCQVIIMKIVRIVKSGVADFPFSGEMSELSPGNILQVDF